MAQANTDRADDVAVVRSGLLGMALNETDSRLISPSARI
jgi:hypothetical protein